MHCTAAADGELVFAAGNIICQVKEADERGWAWGYLEGADDEEPKAYPANYVRKAKAPPPKLPPRPASKPKLKLKYAKVSLSSKDTAANS